MYLSKYWKVISLSWFFQAGKRPRFGTKVMAPPGAGNSGFVRPDVFLNCHVSEFTGLEDVAAFLAFNELGVFIAGHNAYTRMPADFLHTVLFGGSIRDRWILDRIHVRTMAPKWRRRFMNCGYFKPVWLVVKCFSNAEEYRQFLNFGNNG